MFLRSVAGLFTCALLSAALTAQERLPDFGPDGLAGLTAGQVGELAAGGIVFPPGLVKSAAGTTFIEASLVFGRAPDEVWPLLAEPAVQDRYLSEVKSLKLIWKRDSRQCLEFTVRVMGRTVVYRSVLDFFPADRHFRGCLDPDFASEIKELSGFWRLYPFDGGRTLARYGSVVKPRFPIPGFIRDALARGHVRSALESVRKYVMSDGAWRAPRKSN